MNFKDYLGVSQRLEEVIGIPVSELDGNFGDVIDPIEGPVGVPDTYKNRPDVDKPMVLGNDVAPIIE